MVELFRLEVENQSIVLTENLLALELNSRILATGSADACGAFAQRRRPNG